MFFVCALVLTFFFIKLSFLKGISIASVLIKRYGQQGFKLFRETEKVYFKLSKIKCDIEFFRTCMLNNLQPDFVKFKLYNKRLHSAPMYKNL